jgi:hypothetical protein
MGIGCVGGGGIKGGELGVGDGVPVVGSGLGIGKLVGMGRLKGARLLISCGSTRGAEYAVKETARIIEVKKGMDVRISDWSGGVV